MNDSDATEQSGRRRVWSLVGLGLLVLAGVLLLAQPSGEQADENAVESAPLAEARPVATSAARPNAVPTDGYITSRGCRQCHPQQHRSWHASYHRTMTQVVDAETAPPAIRDASANVEGQQYLFSQNGDQFLVDFQDPLAQGEFRRRQLVMMTGSHHMHVFWYESDFKHTPGQLPIVYLKDEQRWIPRQSAFLRAPEIPRSPELGRWNQACSLCHSTHARQRLDQQTRVWDTHVVEFGIACEACHGEGEEHARIHAAEDQEVSPDDPIINPETISHRASSDVCGRCHSIWIPDFASLNEKQFFEQGNPFKPGQLLSQCDFQCIVQASADHRDSDHFRRWSKEWVPDESFWEDGMPRVSGREYNGLIESPCYQRGEMSCLSCHTMHPSDEQPLDRWRDDQLKPGMRGDGACLQCHADYADRVAQHSHHPADSSGSRCQNCHMPHTTYGLLKTIRSHQISSPSVSTSLTTGRPSACALCHLDRSFAWISSHLHDWYGQSAVDIDPSADAATTAVAVIHFLKGDAGQRALQAAAFGWRPAREASGTQWMEPYLLLGANDPYDAIRLISARSLRSLPNRISGDIDALGDWQQRSSAFNSTIKEIEKSLRLKPKAEVLIDDSGTFDFPRARVLIDGRDHRPLFLRE